MKLVHLGPPGAGKGTQAAMVCEKYSVPAISTGNLLRYEVQNGTPLGKEAKSYMDAGNLVPDEIVLGMVAQRLREPDCENGFLLDGFPRTQNQAKDLERAVQLNIAINLIVPDEVIIQRVSGRRTCTGCGAAFSVETIGDSRVCEQCGGQLVIRKDDKPETVKRRLEIYNEQTRPLVDYYTSKGILHNIDGVGTIEEVFERVCTVIDGVR